MSPYRSASALLALVLLAALTGLSAPASAGKTKSKRATDLSLVGPPTAPASDEPFEVTGRLVQVRLAKPLSRKPVDVMQRQPGSSKWKLVESLKTDSEGAFALSVEASGTVELKAVYRGNRKFKKVMVSTAVAPQQELQVLRYGDTTVDVGDEVWMSGTTSSGLVGETVFLEQLVDDDWVVQGRSVVADDATFRVGATSSEGGFDQKFRVRAPGSKLASGAVSTTRTFTVYAWYDLTSMPPVTSPESEKQSLNMMRRATSRVDGQSYGPSWVAAYHADKFPQPFERGQVAFAPTTECDTVTATIGVEAEATSDVRWEFILFIDGQEYNHGYRAKKESVEITIPVTAVNKLRLVNRRDTTRSGVGDAVWAGARIKCAGQP